MKGHPYLGFSLVAVVLTGAFAYVILLHRELPNWVVYLIGINLAAFLLYWYDWLISPAKGERTRIPEWVLLGVEAVGGTIGAMLGMFLFRHKVKKLWFQLRFWLIVFGQFALVYCSPLGQPAVCRDVIGTLQAWQP